MMDPIRISPHVRDELRAQFSDEDAREVERQLESTSLPFLDDPLRQSDRDRVHLTILKLTDGDMAAFPMHLRYASIDWRDVLVAARL